MRASGLVVVSETNEGSQRTTQVETRFEGSRIDLDRLDDVNRVVEEAVTTWKVAERVRRLALPSLLYHETDLRHMRFLLFDDEEGNAVAMAAWEEVGAMGATQSARSAQLHGLYVLPRWQRQGLGSSLLDFVGLWVGMHGLDGITARAWRQAEPFFRQHGFKPLSEQQSSEDISPQLWRSSRWMH